VLDECGEGWVEPPPGLFYGPSAAGSLGGVGILGFGCNGNQKKLVTSGREGLFFCFLLVLGLQEAEGGDCICGCFGRELCLLCRTN